MLGSFQQAHLRIEVDAPETVIRDSLLRRDRLEQWLWTQRFSTAMPEQLHSGAAFTISLGPLAVRHFVERADPNCLRLLLSGSIDGFHEWYWGEGWVQSRLEGVSLLPLNLSHTMNLLRLREFVTQTKAVSA